MKHQYLVLTMALFACAPEVSSNPTYFDDVQAILRANCARCHGADPIDPSVVDFRLDRYVADMVADGETSRLNQDTWEKRAEIVTRAVENGNMPPTFALSDRQKKILQRWLSQGAPKGTRTNETPEFVLVAPTDAVPTADQWLDLTYLATDGDGDGLMATIGWRPTGTNDDTLLFLGLGGGRRQVTIDTGQIASGQNIDVFAIIDDGFSDNPADNQTKVVLLSNVAIDHGQRGTAPAVLLVNPNGGGTLITSPIPITWAASDPDMDDALTIDLMLLRIENNGTEVEVGAIATGLSNSPPYDWDISAVPDVDGNDAPFKYKVRVSATDTSGPNTRSDTSDAHFAIARGTCTTDLVWPNVKPIFETYCSKCHAADPINPRVASFRLDKYDRADSPDAGARDGVFEVKAQVYQKLVSDGSMPPAVEPQPSPIEIANVKGWLLCDAPRGSGSVDARPTFSWTTPNDLSVTTTNTGTVPLAWIAKDGENMLASGEISYAKVTGTAQTLNCQTQNIVTWTTITNDLGVITAGSMSWPIQDGQGCYCLKGTVTDAASQTGESIAKKPVKWGLLCQ